MKLIVVDPPRLGVSMLALALFAAMAMANGDEPASATVEGLVRDMDAKSNWEHYLRLELNGEWARMRPESILREFAKNCNSSSKARRIDSWSLPKSKRARAMLL